MSESFKEILTLHFLAGRENAPIALPSEIPETSPSTLENALVHYKNCQNPVCENCHVARMLELNRSILEFKRYLQLRKHIVDTCKNRNLSDDYRTQTLEMSKFLYTLHLQGVYSEWSRLKSGNHRTASFQCTICDESERVATALNCGHCICVQCSDKLNSCPLCREKILIKLPVFM